MNKLLISSAAAAFIVATAPVVAQSAPPPGVAQGTTAAPVAGRAPQVQMRVISDRVMTRDEVVGHVGKLFAKLDSNRDGYLTRPEIDATRDKFMAMHGDIQKRLADHGVMMGDRGAIFDRLDTNHDGNISRQEFTAARSQVREQHVIVMREGGAPAGPGGPGGPAEPGMRMHMHAMGAGMHFGGRLFDMADANKDGRVSLAEAQSAALTHFDRADLNHDGRITPDERQQAHQLMRAEHRPS